MIPPSSVCNRRRFLQAAAALGSGIAYPTAACSAAGPKAAIKPIRGSWISILWDDRRHFHWNEICRGYTAQQWQWAVKEVAELGMEYLVLLAVAKGGEAFYDTPLLPQARTLYRDYLAWLRATHPNRARVGPNG